MAGVQATRTTSGRATSGYIAGPWVDAFFLIGAPLTGFAVFVLFASNPATFESIPDFHFGGFVADGFITAVIFAESPNSCARHSSATRTTPNSRKNLR